LFGSDWLDTFSFAELAHNWHTKMKRRRRDNKVDFSAFSQQKRAQGTDMLRVKQFEIAMSGNVPMLIWLGKQPRTGRQAGN
jgi:hypothetical protein